MNILGELETETDYLQVGDRIKINFAREEHYATAIQQRGDMMLFLTDDYLKDPMRMNPTDTTEGGWKGSELRRKLQNIADMVDIKDQLIPFEDEEFLTPLSIQEMFGYDENYDECEGQIEWMKDRRHRIALREGELYECGWLSSVDSAMTFMCVNGAGIATLLNASATLGVRPAFMLKNIISESEGN